MFWFLNFFFVILPEVREAPETPCKYTDDQLRHNACMLFAYFVVFALVRVTVFAPLVAARLVEFARRGPCFLYSVRMVLHGPLYIFGIGAVLFWRQLLQSPGCEEMDPELYMKLQLYASYSCSLSILCFLLAFWQSKLLGLATRDYEVEGKRAPPGTIEKMPTCPYDPTTFGDEEGKQYPAECPICLAEWDPEMDVIKLTPCGHVYHEECLGNWFKSNQTCALCRHDVTKALEAKPEAAPEAATAESEQPALPDTPTNRQALGWVWRGAGFRARQLQTPCLSNVAALPLCLDHLLGILGMLW